MFRTDIDFKKYATEYDPIKIGSIDGSTLCRGEACNSCDRVSQCRYEIPVLHGGIGIGTDTEPHDRGILRALHSEYIPNKLVKGNPINTLFVGRLNPRTTVDILKSEFGKFGRILNCRVVRDIVTGKSKQYAFIEFENLGSVDRALKEMQKEYIDGAEMIVEREAERLLAGWRPRRLGGGFGGRKESGQLRFGCQDRPFRRPIMVAQKKNNELSRR